MAVYWPKQFFYIGGQSNPYNAMPRLVWRIIDFAVQNLTTADSAHMLAIPAGTMVLTAGYQTIVTVTDATGQFVIGDTTKGASYCATAVAVAANSFGARPAIAATNTNVLYSANDNIDIKTVTVATLAVGQIKVFAVMCDLMPPSYVDVDGNTKTYTYTDRNTWGTVQPVIV